MSARRFIKLRWILAAVAFLFIATPAVFWWWGHSAAASRVAWVKTVQDAGFHTGESEGIIALPFDFSLPSIFEEFLLVRHMTDVGISTDEEAQRLRKLVKTCPDGTIYFLADGLSPDEVSELERQFQNANFMPMSLMDPFGGPNVGTMPAVIQELDVETAAKALQGEEDKKR